MFMAAQSSSGITVTHPNFVSYQICWEYTALSSRSLMKMPNRTWTQCWSLYYSPSYRTPNWPCATDDNSLGPILSQFRIHLIAQLAHCQKLYWTESRPCTLLMSDLPKPVISPQKTVRLFKHDFLMVNPCYSQSCSYLLCAWKWFQIHHLLWDQSEAGLQSVLWVLLPVLFEDKRHFFFLQFSATLPITMMGEIWSKSALQRCHPAPSALVGSSYHWLWINLCQICLSFLQLDSLHQGQAVLALDSALRIPGPGIAEGWYCTACKGWGEKGIQ